MADQKLEITFKPGVVYKDSADVVTAVLGPQDKQRRLRRENSDLEYIKIGREVFYSGEALNAFLASRARRSDRCIPAVPDTT